MFRRPAAISLAVRARHCCALAWPRRSGPPCRRRPEVLTPDGVSQGGIPVLSLEPGANGATSYRRRRWPEARRPSTPRCGRWSSTTNRQAVPPGVQLPERRPSTGGCAPSGADGQQRLGRRQPSPGTPWPGPTPQSPRTWCGPGAAGGAGAALVDALAGATATPSQVGNRPAIRGLRRLQELPHPRPPPTSCPTRSSPRSTTGGSRPTSGRRRDRLVRVRSDYQMAGSPSRSWSPRPTARPRIVKDVVLDWEPVLGAKTYNLQISTDQNFNTIEHSRNADHQHPVLAGVTLDNDQYYWRVTPVDAAGNTLDWGRRRRLDLPPPLAATSHTLEYPAARRHRSATRSSTSGHRSSTRAATGSRSAAPLTSTWTRCPTRARPSNTTFVPDQRGRLLPAGPGHLLLAGDRPRRPRATSSRESIKAEVRRFTYDPALVAQLVARAPGATVEIPTLRWEPLPGANKYDVTITRVDTGQSWSDQYHRDLVDTPQRLAAARRTAGGPAGVRAAGGSGPSLMAGSQPTFTARGPDGDAGQSSGAGRAGRGSQHVRSRPSTGRRSRRPRATVVYVRRQGAHGVDLPRGSFGYPAGEDNKETWLAADTYQWKVEA